MATFLFPGQGSQKPGMGMELLQGYPAMRSWYERAQACTGIDWISVINGNPSLLDQTRYTQPALFLTQWVAYQWLTDREGSTPHMVSGHSLGEWTAMAVAGVFSFEEGMQLVSLRAQAMEQACQASDGTMAAVIGLSPQEVFQACRLTGEAVIANFNAPQQQVISGPRQDVLRACTQLEKQGARKVVPLRVSGAFHSPLMEPAQKTLEQGLQPIRFQVPRFPVVQNVNGQKESDPDSLKRNLLQQLVAPVLWTDCMQTIASTGESQVVECGHGSVLAQLARKCAPHWNVSRIDALLDKHIPNNGRTGGEEHGTQRTL